MTDWRLQGQEKWLKHAQLHWQTYKNPRADWDHDHCEFCGVKFSENLPDTLREGYATPYQGSNQNFRWICLTCFDDFKNTFEWKIV